MDMDMDMDMCFVGGSFVGTTVHISWKLWDLMH